MISDLRFGCCRGMTCWGNIKILIQNFFTFYICTQYAWGCITCGRFAENSNFVAGTQISLLAPALDSIHISTDLLQSHLKSHKWISMINLGSRVTTGFLACGVTVTSHRFPMRVLPQVTIAVTWRGYTDVVLMRAVTSQTAIPAGTIVVDRLWGRNTKTWRYWRTSDTQMEKKNKIEKGVCVIKGINLQTCMWSRTATCLSL